MYIIFIYRKATNSPTTLTISLSLDLLRNDGPGRAPLQELRRATTYPRYLGVLIPLETLEPGNKFTHTEIATPPVSVWNIAESPRSDLQLPPHGTEAVPETCMPKSWHVHSLLQGCNDYIFESQGTVIKFDYSMTS